MALQFQLFAFCIVFGSLSCLVWVFEEVVFSGQAQLPLLGDESGRIQKVGPFALVHLQVATVNLIEHGHPTVRSRVVLSSPYLGAKHNKIILTILILFQFLCLSNKPLKSLFSYRWIEDIGGN